MNNKKLILLASEFPYGIGETFLESELPYLAKEFKEIIIVSNDMSNNDQREIPENCSALRFDLELTKMEKIRSLWGLINKVFKAEKKYVQNHLKMSVTSGVRNTMLVSLFRAKKVRDHLIKVNGSSDFSNTVCYSYWCDDNALGLALLKNRFPEVKTISRAHGWDLYFEATEFNYLPYRKAIVAGLSELCPISQKGFDYMLNRWGISETSLKINRLGALDGDFLTTGSKFKLLSCSNLIPLKRVELLASALSQISDVELDWFHFGDGPEMSKIKAIADKMPANIKVNLMGRKSNSEILNWYQENAPNLFVNVSTTEGIPVSIMEAMSFGTPVLATDVGGTSEIVNSQNGELLPADLSAELLSERVKAFSKLSEYEMSNKRSSAFETWNIKCNAAKNYAAFAKDLAVLS